MKILNALILTATLTSMFSVAAPRWSPTGTIIGHQVDMRSTEGRVLVRHSAARGEDECSNNGNYYNLDLGSDKAQAAHAAIMAAEATQKEVRFYVNGCSPAGYPNIDIVSSF